MLEGVKMYNEKIYLTPGEILEHDFKIDARGYRPQEVDKYLDMIIRDYTEYNNIIKNLKGQINDLTSDNYTLKQEIRALKEKLEISGDEFFKVQIKAQNHNVQIAGKNLSVSGTNLKIEKASEAEIG